MDPISGDDMPLGESTEPEATEALSLKDEVAKAYDELSYKEAGELDEEVVSEDVPAPEAKEPEEKEEPQEAEKPQRKKRRTVHEMGDPSEAPNDWSAEGKEWFAKQPKEAREEFQRVAKQFQSYRSKEITEIKRREQEYQQSYAQIKGVVEATQQWLPRWGSAGRDPVSAVSEILAFADRVRTDPDQAIEELAKSAGRQITIHNRQGGANGIASEPNIRYEDIYGRVKQDLTREQQQQVYQSQFAQLKDGVLTAINKLQNATNGAGKFSYPDLHSDEVLAQLEPIATSLARANPTLGPEEIILRSYRAINGRIISGTAPQSATLSNGYSRTNLAKRAATSVAGSTGIAADPNLQAKKGETLQQQVARIYSTLDTR